VPGIRLTYLCGTTFRVRNPNLMPLAVRFEVVGTPEAATAMLPALHPDDGRSTTAITTRATGTVRLPYQGRVIQTAANGGGAPAS
jgi:hypothetical protein